MGRGGAVRPSEAEWSSGVAVFLGGCYYQDIFKDPKERHYHDDSVLYNKDERRRLDAAVIGPGAAVLAVDKGALVVSRPWPCPWLKWPKSNSKV